MADTTASVIAAADLARSTFNQGNDATIGSLADDETGPRAANDDWIVLALEFSLPVSKLKPTASAFMMLGLDQGYSQRYFGMDFVPYWKRDGILAVDMLASASTLALSLKDAAAK